MISLDYNSRTPIYKQIVEEIEKHVALGIVKPGEQIESVRYLANSLGINPNTVKKAYTELERKGVTETLSTKGTFIASNTRKVIEEKINNKFIQIEKLMGEIQQLGVSKEDIISRITKE